MRIVSDDRIIGAKEAFSSLGELEMLSPEGLADPACLKQADALFIRSDLSIDATLLSQGQPPFIATPSTGVDHVDFDLLGRLGIEFSHAPGANANSVRDYIVAVLLHLSLSQGQPLRGRTLGVVGVGDIGSRVASAARALGMEVLLSDPPRAERDPDFSDIPLQQLVEASDIVTLHVPLVQQGPHPTHHLFETALLDRLADGALLVNASRGPVVETQALKSALKSGRIQAALDVWEWEPEIDWELLDLVDFGTPHVAGQAVDGKLISTEMIYDACCDHFGIRPAWKAASLLSQTRLEAPPPGPLEERLAALVRLAYDVDAENKDLKLALDRPPEKRAEVFRGLREIYLERREFVSHTVVFDRPCALSEACAGVGFQVAFEPPAKG